MLSLAQRSGGRRTERSRVFGQVTHKGCPNARAQRRPRTSAMWLRRADRPARAGAAAADDVADFFLAELLFADSGSGATMELGRSARPPMLLPAPRSGTGSSTNDRKFCSTDRRGACSRSRAARRHGRRTERSPVFGQITHNGCPTARARGDPHRGWLRREDRPARAGAAAADDVADFFLAELLFADSGSGATMELGRSARPPMLPPAPRSSTGSSTNDRKFCSTDRRGACSRSRSAPAAGVLTDHPSLAK